MGDQDSGPGYLQQFRNWMSGESDEDRAEADEEYDQRVMDEIAPYAEGPLTSQADVDAAQERLMDKTKRAPLDFKNVLKSNEFMSDAIIRKIYPEADDTEFAAISELYSEDLLSSEAKSEIVNEAINNNREVADVAYDRVKNVIEQYKTSNRDAHYKRIAGDMLTGDVLRDKVISHYSGDDGATVEDQAEVRMAVLKRLANKADVIGIAEEDNTGIREAIDSIIVEEVGQQEIAKSLQAAQAV